jgi:hypothetical protein
MNNNDNTVDNNDTTVDNNDNNDTNVDHNDNNTNDSINDKKRKLILDENGNVISKNELKRRLKAERYVQIKKVLQSFLQYYLYYLYYQYLYY